MTRPRTLWWAAHLRQSPQQLRKGARDGLIRAPLRAYLRVSRFGGATVTVYLKWFTSTAAMTAKQGRLALDSGSKQ